MKREFMHLTGQKDESQSFDKMVEEQLQKIMDNRAIYGGKLIMEIPEGWTPEQVDKLIAAIAQRLSDESSEDDNEA